MFEVLGEVVCDLGGVGCGFVIYAECLDLGDRVLFSDRAEEAGAVLEGFGISHGIVVRGACKCRAVARFVLPPCE